MTTSKSLTSLSHKDYILIKGAKHNNLKNVDLAIPQRKLVVITGVSGSGKSSLAFDTVFAEGQRRYIESLSAYIRQFVGKINKPEVDYIKGLSPAIAIQQKVNTVNPRSTVGTTTEIYDYLKLLFARMGTTISPTSGKVVSKHSVQDVLDYIGSNAEGTKYQVLSPIQRHEGRSIEDELQVILQKGFTRIQIGNKGLRIEDALAFIKGKTDDEDVKSLMEAGSDNLEQALLLIDRLAVSGDQDSIDRAADSIQTAFFEGVGNCIIEMRSKEGTHQRSFSDRFEEDGVLFEEPSVNLFTFNNPYGACKRCEGFGTVIGIDEDKVIPDKSLSVYEDAVASWKGEKMQEWKEDFVRIWSRKGFPIHRSYIELSAEEKDTLWQGKGGINEFFSYLQANAYKIQYRVLMSRYKGKTDCPECRGTRLRKDASYVKIYGKSISDLVLMPIDELNAFFDGLELNEYELALTKRILPEIKTRLKFLLDVGLDYLTLNRDARTLSGGESQRIQLVTSLGSTLTGSLYVLDEPSIGLHPRDTERLIGVLQNLRDLKNSVLVVEHDEDIMSAADHIIDMGPYAGSNGGELVFEGDQAELLASGKSLTADYLNGVKEIALPEKRRKPKQFIGIKSAYRHNLQNIDVSVPLNCMCVVTGVSGSGKSTLISDVLFPSLQNKLRNPNAEPKNCLAIEGPVGRISQIEYVDQNPIGKSSRSNPVTYLKAYDSIRSLFASLPASKAHGYTPAYFSFNVDGGRCPECKGDGHIVVEMQFMADLELLCDECKGRRFKPEILDVKYKGKSIHDVLEMTVDDALLFFQEQKDILRKIQILQDVGLGYLRLGQPSNNLSGGEAQRIKLAYFLAEGHKDEHILFVFDEPTTGLHFHDISFLLKSFNRLIEKGHSLVIIEHNLDVIKCADWIIDLGPDGGRHGGQLLYEGAPEGLLDIKASHTAKHLAPKL